MSKMDPEAVKSVNLKPIASNYTTARSDFVEVDQSNNVEVSHNRALDLPPAATKTEMTRGG